MVEPLKITIKAARVNANLTQSELAERLGVTKQTIFNWEKGAYEPTIGQARKLSEVCGVPLDNIILPSKSN